MLSVFFTLLGICSFINLRKISYFFYCFIICFFLFLKFVRFFCIFFFAFANVNRKEGSLYLLYPVEERKKRERTTVSTHEQVLFDLAESVGR